MDPGTFARELEVVQQQVTQLNDLGPFLVEPRELLERMSQMLEELTAASEELRRQRSQLVESEEALAVERRRFEELWDSSPFGLLVSDTQGLILRANGAGAEILGMRPERLAKKPLTLFVGEEDRADFRRRLLDVSANSRRDRWDARMVSAASTSFFATVWASSVENNGHPIREIRWTILDVTEEKRQARELVTTCRELERRVNEVSLRPASKPRPPARSHKAG